MKKGACVQAAIEVLEDVVEHKRPPSLALKDWSIKHRFAGVKDRASIGDIVFMALRLRASSSYILMGDNPRNWVLGALKNGFGYDVPEIEEMAEVPHGFDQLTKKEIQNLENRDLKKAPEPAQGDYPEWLDASLDRTFGDFKVEEMAEFAKPAPIDIRVNLNKTTREKLFQELKKSPKLKSEIALCAKSAWGIRIDWNYGKSFPYNTEPSFLKGEFEVQDEASQLCAYLVHAKKGEKIADICAGAGGKSLALALQKEAQIYAYDTDRNRLAPIYERVRRAGATNVNVISPLNGDELNFLYGRCDKVLVDAPCTGSGTWRRAPDTKWRLTPENLKRRQTAQLEALEEAILLLKRSGKIYYVTCSILAEENDDTIIRFLQRHKEYTAINPLKYMGNIGRFDMQNAVHYLDYGIQFSPLKSGTDGFYFAVLERKR